MHFEFATAARILFGRGVLREAGPVVRQYGRRALLVTGRHPDRAAPLIRVLSEAGVDVVPFSVPGEPTTTAVIEGARHLKRACADVVIGCGGGSAIDAAKAIAAMATNPGDLLDYLEVVGRGLALSQAPVPFIAVPTTAGAGAEVTRNAVLGAPEHRVKVSLRSPLLLARVAVVDPAVTLGLPRTLTASTGLDALTQLIEPFVSPRANPLTDGFCREGLGRIARSLRRACEAGEDLAAREDMSLAALLGGLSLANAGLGAVHGFAGPIGGMFEGPHGAICAALLPHVMAANLLALRSRLPGSESLRRYEIVARLLTGREAAGADEGVAWARELCGDLQVPGLRACGVTAADFPSVVEKAAKASSMKANPLPLTGEELTGILAAAW